MKPKRSAPIGVELIGMQQLYTTYSEHTRLSVFAKLGRKCVTCGREGNVLMASTDRGGGLHIDLYADHTLMTVDHIVPKSVAKRWGWPRAKTEALDNKQPMCEPCNVKKGNKFDDSHSNARHQWVG